MIELKSVTKLYGTVIGVNDISLSLPAGAYGLLGPNGSGKTTLLNLITGQLKPTLGTVRVLGGSPRNNNDLFRRIGFCPGSDGMYSRVSGFAWIAYLLRLHGFSRRDAKQRATATLERVGMRQAMHRPISDYSRGMRQRVKLAQALAHDPEFLILDEPLSGLDPIARHDMTVLLRDWIASGRNLLLASHILHEVEAITDSFLLICGGRLLASGNARDVEEILSGVPCDIQIDATQPRLLAERLFSEGIVDRIEFSNGNSLLTVTTPKPSMLYERLPALTAELDVKINGLCANNESLDSLFRSLMKIHRGEE